MEVTRESIGKLVYDCNAEEVSIISFIQYTRLNSSIYKVPLQVNKNLYTLSTICLLQVASLVCATYGQYDSPTPSRPIIPGAVPVGAVPVAAARPVLRRRPQQQQSVQDLPPPRRISPGRGSPAIPARRLPTSLQEQSLGSPRPSRPTFSEPVIRAPQPPVLPPVLASPAPLQSSSLPQQYSPSALQQISPRPVVEELEEELDFPPVQHPTQAPPQPLAFRPSPLDDLPIPTRQQV